MALIPKVKIGEFDLLDTAVVAGSKILGEKALAPYIGNGTVVSGGTKLVLATLVASMSKNKTARMIATGVATDGAEDILLGLNPFGFFRGVATQDATDSVVRI